MLRENDPIRPEGRRHLTVVALRGALMMLALLLGAAAALQLSSSIASDGDSPIQAPCVAGSWTSLLNCTRQATPTAAITPVPHAIAIHGLIHAPPNHWTSSIVVRNNSQRVTIFGSSSAALPALHGRRGGLSRSNFSQPLLTISNNRAPVHVVDMAFEDPQRGTCYEDDRCGWYAGGCAAQVVISGLNSSGTGVDAWGPSSGVVFERCVFVRGYDITIQMGGVDGITFTKNLWFHHQTFGMWAGAPGPAGVSASRVNLLNNVWYHGQNNAILAPLGEFSLIQGCEFIHNHHVSCFNASGGQVALGASTSLTVRSNLIANGAIMDGDPRFKWAGNTTPFATHGFELNDGLLNFSMHHNDVRNNTGWSVIANRSPTQYCAPSVYSPQGGCPGVDCKTCGAFCPSSYLPDANPWPGPSNTSVHYGDNRMCSNVRDNASRPISYHKARTVCGNPYACNLSSAPWLVDEGRNCLGKGGGSECDCAPPLRPRGQISALPGACILTDGESECTTTASWWSVDTESSAVHVLVLNDVAGSNGSPVPASVVSGDISGANGTVTVRLGAKTASSVRVQLTMVGWGLLDETYATIV